MALFIKLAFCFLISFFITILIGPIVIYFIKKEKAKQTILSYVDFHEKKQGTPTMGGIIFVLSSFIASFILFEGNILISSLTLIIVFGYFLIGFFDDFIKVKLKKNEGLTPIQKIILQFIVALIAGIVFYIYDYTNIIIPFSGFVINIGIWIVPTSIIVYLATTNAVNLTDGLDGLASSNVLIYLISLCVLVSINSSVLNMEFLNIQILSMCFAGGLLGFIFFNGYPAEIFMGDTGSIALGGLVATVSIITGNLIYILLLGMVFVISSLSVILQVLHYKRTKRRIFLMAPLHHHFEKKGMHEVKIVIMYMLFTITVSIITLVLEYYF